MVISVLKLAGGAATETHGTLVLDAMMAELGAKTIVTVSFEGVDYATTSFVNSSFVKLLDCMDFDAIKSRILVVSANSQIKDIVRRVVTWHAQNGRGKHRAA